MGFDLKEMAACPDSPEDCAEYLSPANQSSSPLIVSLERLIMSSKDTEEASREPCTAIVRHINIRHCIWSASMPPPKLYPLR